MLNNDGLHLFIDDDIFLTLCCVLDKHTQVISCLEMNFLILNIMAIVARIVVKSIPYFPFH
jgi:hypothetical protein